MALPSRLPRNGDGARSLPPPSASVCRRAPPLPPLAPPRLRPRPSLRRGALPVPSGHERSRHPDRRWKSVRDLRLAAADQSLRATQRRARRSGDKMTVLEPAVDTFDVRRARRLDGVLREFNDAGVLTAADVHVARRLGEFA